MPSISLCPSRLENVRQRGEDIISACPACREGGKDRAGDNLRVFASGAFHCIAHPKEREHNRRIIELAGISGDGEWNPERDHAWLERRFRERQRERERETEAIRSAARKHRAAIICRHPWNHAEVWEDSPQHIDSPLVEFDSRHFLASLYPASAILWAGAVNHSGANHSACWKPCPGWQRADTPPGPMTCPAVWKPGIHSRAAANVLATPYTVLDFDGFDGVSPTTPDALRAHLRASLALVRFLRERMDWTLATIIWTGGKSLHAWFHTPLATVLQSLHDAAPSLGLDAGLIGHPEHPCRLPGWEHEKTGKRSRVLWLQSPHSDP